MPWHARRGQGSGLVGWSVLASLGQVMRQGVPLQLPHLVDDPLLADFNAHGVVVVEGIDTPAGLDDFEPIGEGQRTTVVLRPILVSVQVEASRMLSISSFVTRMELCGTGTVFVGTSLWMVPAVWIW